MAKKKRMSAQQKKELLLRQLKKLMEQRGKGRPLPPASDDLKGMNIFYQHPRGGGRPDRYRDYRYQSKSPT